jgi:hypothetical protein
MKNLTNIARQGRFQVVFFVQQVQETLGESCR